MSADFGKVFELSCRCCRLVVLLTVVTALGSVACSDLVAQEGSDVLSAGAIEDYSSVKTDPAIWTFDIKVLKVRAMMPVEGIGKGKLYWYVVYEVENKSGQDRDAFISVTATTDNNKKYASIPARAVERAVERKFGRPLWGWTDRIKEQEGREPDDDKFFFSTFKKGEKRKCVAIMSGLDGGANTLKIRFRGLSNDYKTVEASDGSRKIQERVFETEYYRPGDGYDVPLDRFIYRGENWLKIETPLVLPPAADEDE